MIGDLDKIINICQQPRGASNQEIKNILFTLATTVKQLMISLQQSGLDISMKKQQKPVPVNVNKNEIILNEQIYGARNHFFQNNQPPFLNYNDTNQKNIPNNVPRQAVIPANNRIEYPICLTYVNKINQWWPPEKIAAGLGVPGYAQPTLYNYFVLSFWSYTNGPLDIVCIWADPVKYFGDQSVFGSNKVQIQKNIKKKYNQKGIKLLISAFGATQFPTSANINPIDCADKLGQFVSQNNLDGVDIDWEDNQAMQAGRGQKWLIQFQTRLRQILPQHIITHAPQAPYFKKQHYKNGAYITVNEEVGKTIDFYNVQFYNQGDTMYNTFESLFERSGSYFSGTSVYEISSRGIPLEKIIVGKPVTQMDCTNTGIVDHSELGNWIMRANSESRWCGGVMYWQYVSDCEGKQIKKSMGKLIQKVRKSNF